MSDVISPHVHSPLVIVMQPLRLCRDVSCPVIFERSRRSWILEIYFAFILFRISLQTKFAQTLYV